MNPIIVSLSGRLKINQLKKIVLIKEITLYINIFKKLMSFKRDGFSLNKS